jgi:hypothetical protein
MLAIIVNVGIISDFDVETRGIGKIISLNFNF